jgi:hypothetical protein
VWHLTAEGIDSLENKRKIGVFSQNIGFQQLRSADESHCAR